jgi:hypothetical protein
MVIRELVVRRKTRKGICDYRKKRWPDIWLLNKNNVYNKVKDDLSKRGRGKTGVW